MGWGVKCEGLQLLASYAKAGVHFVTVFASRVLRCQDIHVHA